jgi:hypothetical protein
VSRGGQKIRRLSVVKIKITAIAVAICAMVAIVASAPAATVLTSGSTYDGWIVTIPPGISLTESSATSTNLDLSKTASFSTQAEGLLIVFTQDSASAAPNIIFQNETLKNNTGSGWGGFEFLLLNPNASATFSGSPFTPATGYSLLSADSTTTSVLYAGAQADGASSQWGLGDNGGELTIATDPSGIGTTFVLKELPLTTQFVSGLPVIVGQPIAVPLPPALWQGLAGGTCLVLVGLFRRRQHSA